MNENKVPCGGFEVDPTYFHVFGGQLGFNVEFIDTFNFMPGYCAKLIQSATNEWLMDSGTIGVAISFTKQGYPVFLQIRERLGEGRFAYSVGNLCYYEEGKKLIFSCPQSNGTTFGVKFYDVNINTGVVTVTTKELN